MRRRHPHLFDLGEAEPWERIKRRERSGKTLCGYRPHPSAAAQGLPAPGAGGVGRLRLAGRGPARWQKVREELAEVEQELDLQPPSPSRAESADPNTPSTPPSERLKDEIGDLLFAVVNLARKAGVQPGPALDRANRKFRERFEAVEALCAERGIDVDTAGLEVLDGLWEEVKKGGQVGGRADGQMV